LRSASAKEQRAKVGAVGIGSAGVHHSASGRQTEHRLAIEGDREKDALIETFRKSPQFSGSIKFQLVINTKIATNRRLACRSFILF
jgi:hypothetical protein